MKLYIYIYLAVITEICKGGNEWNVLFEEHGEIELKKTYYKRVNQS